MRVNMPVTQNEIKLAPGQTIVSKTTPKGVITLWKSAASPRRN